MSSRRSQPKITPVAPPVVPKATVDQIKAADRPYTPDSSRKPLPDFGPMTQASKRPRLSASTTPALRNSPASSGTNRDADDARLDKMLDAHLAPPQKALEEAHEKRAGSQTNVIAALINQLSAAHHKLVGSQSEAALELKDELSEMYQKTVGSQAGAVQGLEKQLSSMTKSRDEGLKEMGLRAREILGLQSEVSGWIKGYEDRGKEISSLRTELSQLKESLEGRQREAFQFRLTIQGLQKQLTSSRELAAAKSNELLKRQEGLEALKAQTEKSVDEIKKGTERVVLEAEKNVLDAEKNAEEAQGIIEENKKEGDKIQRELQDDIAKLRVKEVDSKRKIRRLLEVIRDAAPDKFREEVMKDNFFDIMF